MFFLITGVTFLAVISLGYMFIEVTEEKENQKMWKKAAEKLGLTFQPAFFVRLQNIAGTYQGVKIKLYEVVLEHENMSTTYTNYVKAHFNKKEWKSIKIVRYEAAEKLAIAFGGADIKVDHPAFDERLRIAAKNIDESVLATLRRSDVQRRILQLESDYFFYINNGVLELRWSAMFESTEEILTLAQDAVDLVNLLESSHRPQEASAGF